MKKFLFAVILGAVLIGVGSGLTLIQLRNNPRTFAEIHNTIVNLFRIR